MKAKKLALLALFTAIALTIYVIEAQIPIPIPLPGVKLGLSNIVTVFTVFAFGPAEGAMVLACRIFLGAVFAGNFSSILYSAAGGACAIVITVLLRRVLRRREIWVAGVLGAAAHNFGQVAVAAALLGSGGVWAYLPILCAIGMVCGLFTGVCAQLLVNRGEKLWKIT
ncbi:MAG: Gx transporter family protein [Firmicutes bacterium]|nr:Gx transporter family protein [Bacillota bacterium]